MITLTQLQHLNPGDKLLAEVEYHSTNGTGEIVLAKVCIKAHEKESKIISYFHPSILSLPSEHGTLVPTPKHDPTRRFKKGDKVRVVNTFAVAPDVLSLPEENTILFFPSSIFKNITPNEKQQLASFLNAYAVDKRRKDEMHTILKKIGIDLTDAPPSPDRTFCHPHAKGAAQAECDRLNAEYRKEQNHD